MPAAVGTCTCSSTCSTWPWGWVHGVLTADRLGQRRWEQGELVVFKAVALSKLIKLQWVVPPHEYMCGTNWNQWVMRNKEAIKLGEAVGNGRVNSRGVMEESGGVYEYTH